MLYIENMTKGSYIIGIDPGLVNTGWGIIKTNGNHIQFVSCGTIKPNAKDNMAKRLQYIYSEIDNVCKQYFNKNSVVDSCIEDVFVNKNPDTSLKLGQASGVAMLSLVNNGYDVYDYQNREVKKSITGTGSSDKKQIQAMVKILLNGAEIDSEHSGDALAIAITHSHFNNYNKLLVADI